jgi:post-segregation antitoxin (ccd killing protein)
VKKKLTLSIDEFLINEAHREKINISELLEETLSEKLHYKKLWVKS